MNTADSLSKRSNRTAHLRTGRDAHGRQHDWYALPTDGGCVASGVPVP